MIRALLVLLLAVVPLAPAAAQSGALFLLVPFGARAVGQGEAVVADSTMGTESIWWNPAGSARATKRELAVHHSTTFGATSDMVAFMVPSEILGTVSGAFYLVDYGDFAATDSSGNYTGSVYTHNYMGALSYSVGIGSRLSAGLSYKFVMLRFGCSGYCAFPLFSGSSSALDLGMQYRMPAPFPLMIGATLRNLGPALQVKDSDQADPLPRVFQFGARTRLPIEAIERNNSSLELMADYKVASALGSGAIGGGAVLGYRDEFFLRFGYYHQPGQGSGPSIGLGMEQGAFTVDLSRRFDEFASQVGTTPTYISLRVRF